MDRRLSPPHQGQRLDPLAHDGTASRLVAVFEAFKALLALAAGLGLFGWMHPGLRVLGASLIGHVGLPPGAHYPRVIPADLVQTVRSHAGPMYGLVAAYAAVHLAEAYGLWRGRRWGARLGVLSGSLYIPFELTHVLHRVSVTAVAVLLLNLLVVAVLVTRVARSAAPAASGQGLPRALAAPTPWGRMNRM